MNKKAKNILIIIIASIAIPYGANLLYGGIVWFANAILTTSGFSVTETQTCEGMERRFREIPYSEKIYQLQPGDKVFMRLHPDRWSRMIDANFRGGVKSVRGVGTLHTLYIMPPRYPHDDIIVVRPEEHLNLKGSRWKFRSEGCIAFIVE